jgi:IclR family KDG regulon transcriptional repressor
MTTITTSTAEEAQPKIAGTAAFSKFIAVLQLIADQEEPLSIAQISALSGYPRPTVYRILAALIAEGMVVENTRTKHFTLGARLINLASKSWEQSDIRKAAIDPLQILRDTTRETVHLAVPSDAGMVYIEKLESPQAVRMTSRIGTRVTLYSSAVGKAYLSMLDDKIRDPLYKAINFKKYTDTTITDLSVLKEEIALTSQRGYAEDREENEPQIFCFGSAIVDRHGQPVGCISISIPIFRKNANIHDAYITPLIIACKTISDKLSVPF